MAKSVQLRDARPLERLQAHLNKLTSLLFARGAMICLSIEDDVPIALSGNIGMPGELSLDVESALFSGIPILDDGYYYEPVIFRNQPVGYLVLFRMGDEMPELARHLVEITSQVVSKELELADQTAALEYQNERVTRKQKQLEQAIAFKNNILALTTHDLRSPLSAISGFLEMMGETLQQWDTSSLDALREYHLALQKGVNNVNDMVEQLHEIALLELQRIELNLIKVDLNWVVQEVVDVLQGPAITKKQTLTMTRSKTPLYVEIDIPKMKRILFNLVGNAIKYTREGGRIDVGLFPELSQAVVYVKDNGIGIPSDKLNIIFEPFSKLKRHGTSGEASNGLGLFTSQYMAKLFKGIITVESALNEGSTFYLKLPTVTASF